MQVFACSETATGEGSDVSATDGQEGGGIGGHSGKAAPSSQVKNHYSDLSSRNSNSLEPNSDLN